MRFIKDFFSFIKRKVKQVFSKCKDNTEHLHEIKYFNGYGYRCSHCFKPKSQCKGKVIVSKSEFYSKI